MARAATIVLLAALNFIMSDCGKLMLLAVTDISEAGNVFANTSGIERMATGWLKTIDAPHNHFPSFAVGVFNRKIINHLEFSCKEVSYLMRDCIFLKVLAILLDKFKIKINNATLHWLYISCCSALLEKLNTLKWDVDIKFGCSDGKSLLNIIFGKRHYL
jgi:hypothetical protein